jgi:hypothetical protein
MEYNIHELFSFFPTYTQKQKDDLIVMCNNNEILKYGAIDYLIGNIDFLSNHLINYIIIEEYIKFCAELDIDYTKKSINNLAVTNSERNLGIHLLNIICDKLRLERENKRLREELNYYKPLDKASIY